MRKSILVVTILEILLLTACGIGNSEWGVTYISDSTEYGKFGKDVTIPDYMPESVDEYTVNQYSYTSYSYMDTCYEIFLDISVTEEQFDNLISKVRLEDDLCCERVACYADGYTEIVFEDSYKICNEDVKSRNVGWADIDKVIYNKETGNIIFEVFHTNDTGVYELEKVVYFDKFGIEQEEYVENVVIK